MNSKSKFKIIYGRKREVIFFYFVPDTKRDKKKVLLEKNNSYLDPNLAG
jgi:hypothetical protein